jgi:arsenate reductase
MIKVLFVCVHNSARSQMAEAFLNQLGAGSFIAESAGLEPGILNPLVVEAMAEIGYDISGNPTNSVFEFFKEGRIYAIVVKVCDQLSGQQCPIFPNTLKVFDWNIEDPSAVEGNHEEKMAQVRKIRDEIKSRVETLIKNYGSAT